MCLGDKRKTHYTQAINEVSLLQKSICSTVLNILV